MSLFTSGARGGDLRALVGVLRHLAALNTSASSNATRSAGSGSASGSMEDVVVGSSSESDADDFLVSNYGDESAAASSDADLMYRRTQGSCAYYPVSASGCRAPRSCFDCLNYDVAPERASCMVNERGQCVSVTGNYTASRDYRYAAAANSNSSSNSSSSGVDVSASLISGPGAEFAAANATYCAWGDAKCAACRRGVFLEYSTGSITRTSLFCLGQDGCVCVALCEMDDWATRVGGSRCTNTTTTAQAGSSTSSSAGDMTPVNSGAGGGGTTDESTRGGVGGHGGSDADTSGGLGTFWSVACGVLAVLAVTLAVVMYMSKRHRQSHSRRRQHLGTPQAPTLSPRSGQRPPESLLASLFHQPDRNSRARQAGSTTAETSAHPTDAESTEGDIASDDNRSLRLFGWQAMRQQVIEKETLRPVVVSSGIRRVAISRCLPCEATGNGGAISSECLSSPRSLPALGHFEEEEIEHAILGGGVGDSRRFTITSLSSSAMLSPPSYVIPFMDERDDDDDDDDRERGNTTGDCFDELVTPPARSRMLL